jgi:hypothetical protein
MLHYTVLYQKSTRSNEESSAYTNFSIVPRFTSCNMSSDVYAAKALDMYCIVLQYKKKKKTDLSSR